MKLTDFEKQRMNNDIAAIIDDWSSILTIKRLKPSDMQPGWNPILNEIVGDPEYDVISDIPVEVNPAPFMATDSNSAGDQYIGKCFIHVPTDRYDMIRQLNDDVISIRIWLPSYICNKIGHDIDTPILLDDECILTLNTDIDMTWRLLSIKCLRGDIIITAKRMVGDSNGG